MDINFLGQVIPYTIAIQDIPNIGTLRTFWKKQESAGLT